MDRLPPDIADIEGIALWHRAAPESWRCFGDHDHIGLVMDTMASGKYGRVWKATVHDLRVKLRRLPTPEEIDDHYVELLSRFTAQPNTKLFRLPGLPYRFQGVPGLTIRSFTEQDAQSIIPLMAHDTKALATQAIDERKYDPFCHILVWDFNGHEVRTQAIMRWPNNVAWIGISVHVMTRTAAFWRESERPVFEQLAALGITEIRELVLPALVPYWESFLIKAYGATQISMTDQGPIYSYPVDLTRFRGWPQRRTAGPGWRFDHGAMVVQEMQEADLPVVEAWVTEQFRLRANFSQVKTMLREMWALDRASVLVGYVAGVLKHVQVVREQTATRAIASYLSPRVVSRDSMAQEYGLALWLRAAGYTDVVSRVSQAQHDSPKMMANMTKIRQGISLLREHKTPHTTIYEYGGPVETVLKHSLTQWMALYHE